MRVLLSFELSSDSEVCMLWSRRCLPGQPHRVSLEGEAALQRVGCSRDSGLCSPHKSRLSTGAVFTVICYKYDSLGSSSAVHVPIIPLCSPGCDQLTCHIFAVQRVRDALISEREALLEELQDIPFLEPYPSQANFILCKVSYQGC